MIVANLLRSCFGPTMPSAPTLTLADKGDGTGATATIGGSTPGSTNTVFVAAVPAASDEGPLTWTNAGNRTGDGTLNLSLSDGFYLAYCQSTFSGLSSPSDQVAQWTSGGSVSSSSVRAALYTFLSQSADITPIVGGRVYPVKMPQGAARPAIVYRRMPAKEKQGPDEWLGHLHTLAGGAGAAVALFKLDCLGDSYATADALDTAVRQALDGLTQAKVAGVTLLGALIDDEMDDFDEPIDASDTGVYVASTLYWILYTES